MTNTEAGDTLSSSERPADASSPLRRVSFGEATRVWARIGLLSFGGPAGQIALMHKELVEERRWISEPRFLHALNYCMLLPGPEAMQLAVYIGWLMHRVAGGIVAGLLFALPGYFSVLALSIAYCSYRDLPIVAAVFFGLKAAVLAVVVEAMHRIGKRALKTRLMVATAATAFVALFFFRVPFPLVIVCAALFGAVCSRWIPSLVPAGHAESATDDRTYVVDSLLGSGALHHTRPSLRRSVTTTFTWLAIWLLPVVAASLWLGRDHVLAKEGTFFSKTAVVTFGGAYAVLAYISQRAVDVFGWLTAGEMLDGLGLAETTPGPLILVVEFVGFVGAYRNPGPWSPLLAGLLGATMTAWVTFAPCYLWIFGGAPFVERFRQSRPLSAALSVVTAAVVGVILNLSTWFAEHTLFDRVHAWRWGAIAIDVPAWDTLRFPVLVLAAGSAIALFRFRAPVGRVLLGCALAGATYQLWARG